MIFLWKITSANSQGHPHPSGAIPILPGPSLCFGGRDMRMKKREAQDSMKPMRNEKETGRIRSILFTLAIVIGLMLGMSVTDPAWAGGAEPPANAWKDAYEATQNKEFSSVNVYDNTTVIIRQGITLTVTGSISVSEGKTLIISGSGNLIIQVSSRAGILLLPDSNLTIAGSTVSITGAPSLASIMGSGGNSITISGGHLSTGNGNTYGMAFGMAFAGASSITINSGSLSVTGSPAFVSSGNLSVTNAIPGMGWNNSAGTGAGTWIPANSNPARLGYKKVLFSNHIHDFSYSASGATITATCSVNGCPNGYDTSGITLTLNAPGSLTYNRTARAATITGYPSDPPLGLEASPTILYYYSTGAGSTVADGNALSGAPTDAGYYVAKITWGGKTASKAFTISKATPSMSGELSTTAVYGDTMGTVLFWLDSQKPLGADGLALDGSWSWVDSGITGSTPVGYVGNNTSQAKFTPADSTNYDSLCKDVTVNVAEKDISLLTVEIPENNSLTYHGSGQAPVMTVKDGETQLLADTDYTVGYQRIKDSDGNNVTEGVQITPPIGAGTYNIVIQGRGNYIGTKSKKFVIHKAPVTITGLSASNKTYDGTTAAAVTGTAVVNGTKNHDNVIAAWDSAVFTDANVGKDKTVVFTGLRLTGADAANYTLSEQPTDVKADITPASLIITVKGQTYPYDGQPHGENNTVYQNADPAKVDVSGLQGNDTITMLGLSGQATDTGESDISVTALAISGGTANDNYSVTKNPGKLTISPKPVTATVTGVDRDYEAGNRKVSLAAGTVNDAVAGDDVTADVSDAAGEMADDQAGINKAVTVTGVKLSGAKAGNYTLTEQPAGVTVNIRKLADPAVITDTAYVTLGGNTVDLGGNVTGAIGEASWEFDGDANGCTLKGSVLTSGNAAGTCKVTVTVADSANHAGKTGTITVTVTDKAAADLTVTQADSVYGAAPADPVWTRPANPVKEAVIRYSGTTAAGAAYGPDSGKPTEAGSYSVTVTEETADTIHSGSAGFTISKAEPAVTAPKANTLTYNGSAQALVTAGEAEGGEMQYALGTDDQAAPDKGWSTDLPTAADAGTWVVWYSVLGDENHENTNPAPVAAGIAKKDVTVTAADQEVLQGEAIDTSVSMAVLSGAPEGHVLASVTLTSSATDAPTADGTITPGAATILAGDTDVTANYNITYADGKLTVIRKTETVTVTFRAGGGKGKMTAVQVEKGTKYALPECGFTAPKGSEFSRWDRGAPGRKITVNEDTVITAQWKPVKLTVTFDPNGGDGAMKAVKVKYGTEYTLPKCKFTAPFGMQFDKWDKGAAGKKIRITKDLTIRAKWKKIPVKKNYTFFAKMVSAGKTALRITWQKVSGADGYEVWMAVCEKGAEFTQINGGTEFSMMADVKASKALSFKKTGLKSGQSYKAYIRAYRLDGKKKTYIGRQSERVHAIAGGSSREKTNPKSVTVKTPEVTLRLSEKETFTIQATVKGVKSRLQVLDHGDRLLRYYSSNLNIAKVSASGKITGVNAGECTVWVVANNGIRTAVTVKVIR